MIDSNVVTQLVDRFVDEVEQRVANENESISKSGIIIGLKGVIANLEQRNAELAKLAETNGEEILRLTASVNAQRDNEVKLHTLWKSAESLLLSLKMPVGGKRTLMIETNSLRLHRALADAKLACDIFIPL